MTYIYGYKFLLMTLTQLQYVVTLAKHRHFAKAAAACFVTQPTLSMQIQKLEEELNVLIFDRSSHPVGITEVGKNLIDQAEIVLREAGKLEQLLEDRRGDHQGEFRLGIIPTLAPSLLPRFLTRFISKFPKVHLVIEEAQTDQILEKLRLDQLHAGLLATPLMEKGMEEFPLYYEPFVAFVPEGHRLWNEQFVTHSELELKDMLLLSSGHCFRNSVINLCAGRQEQNDGPVQLESGNFETLIRLGKQGLGMTLIPYLTGADLQKEDQRFLRPISEPQPTREVSLVYTKAQLKTQLIKQLGAIIQEAVPKRLLKKDENVISPR